MTEKKCDPSTLAESNGSPVQDTGGGATIDGQEAPSMTLYGQITIELYSIIVGLAISFAIEQLLTNPSLVTLISFFSLFSTVLIWFHGQTGLMNNTDYDVFLSKLAWHERVVEKYIDVAIMGGYIFMAFFLSNAVAFLGAYFTICLLDVLLNVAIISKVPEEELLKGNGTTLRQLAKEWLAFDLTFQGVIVILLLLKMVCPAARTDAIISIAFLTVTIVLNLLDYRVHKHYFFG